MSYKEIKLPTNTKFLVTGGAGFIGSNLCFALIEMGYHVVALDNLSTGKMSNILALMDHPRFEFIKGDIREYDVCLHSCENVDFVLHQAAWGSVPKSLLYPLDYEDINIKGTLNMLEAARKCKVKRVVFASSSSVYGDEPTLPKIEGKEGNLLSPYALTKKVNEEYARLYWSQYGLETIGLRYFNVFGKQQDPNGMYAAVIPKFIKQLLNNEKPIINGDGTQSRDFTYIENVIEANIKACISPVDSVGKSYNIAYGGRISILELYNVISRILKKDIEPIFGPSRPGDILHSNADINAAVKSLGYNPDWNFIDGISEAIDWYINYLQNWDD